MRYGPVFTEHDFDWKGQEKGSWILQRDDFRFADE